MAQSILDIGKEEMKNKEKKVTVRRGEINTKDETYLFLLQIWL